MWKGTYKKWNPIPEYEGKDFEVDAVYDNQEGFRVWLCPQNINAPILIAKFEFPLFYASSDGGHRLNGATNDLSGQFPHPFWQVEDSALVAEFKRQGAGVRDNQADPIADLGGEQCE